MNSEKVEKKLLSTIEKAISQANVTYLHNKVKVTNTTYDEDVKKPSCEVVEDKEVLKRAVGEYDIAKIKALAELWLKIKDSTSVKADDTSGFSGGVVILPSAEIESKGESDVNSNQEKKRDGEATADAKQ